MYVSYDENNKYSISIYAITKDGNIQIYSNGNFNEYVLDDVIDIYQQRSYREVDYYYLTSKGVYVKIGNDITLLKDVVSIQDKFLITRSGTIYTNSTDIKKYNEKAIVYDEWLERME